MGAQNRVIAGDYIGNGIAVLGGIPNILCRGSSGNIMLDKFGIEAYEMITEETRKSASSGILRGAVGAALLGPVGLLAGVSAKNKGVYTIAIVFKDGKKSLIEIDEKIYKAFIKANL